MQNEDEKMKVMMVEEAIPYLELQRTFLARHNVTILEAPGTMSTVETIRITRPRVTFIDVQAPERNGLTLCRGIKEDLVARTVPVVLLVDPDDVKAAKQVGADSLLQKPVQMREFLDTVRRFVDLKERRSPRVPVNLRFSYSWNGETGQLFSREISEFGAFLKTDQNVPEGSELELRFHLPGQLREIRCTGIVRRCYGMETMLPIGPGLGVEFVDIAPEDQLRFQRFVSESVAKGNTN